LKRTDAYTVLATKYGMTVKGVKNKIKSLLSYFSKEHQKVTEKKSGAGAEDKTDPSWFVYRSMLLILDSVTQRQRRTHSTVLGFVKKTVKWILTILGQLKKTMT
jgi:hypothetical protein